MTVLIVTKSDDVASVDQVTDHLRHLGVASFRLDSDRYPTEVRIVETHDNGGDDGNIIDETRGTRLAIRDISAVWYRRFAVAEKLPSDLDPKLRAPSELEARTSLLGLMVSLPCFVMDPYDVVRRASHKALQLRIAREVGLPIPRTLTTNDPDAVRKFVAASEGPVITKMLSSFAVYDAAGREQVVFTTRLGASDLDDLSGLALCPMTFQEEVPKTVELRATVVGDRVFTAAVDAKALAGAEVDWRRRGRELCPAWEPYPLPAQVEQGLITLARTLGLNYGAADFIVHPDGRHVFLEINPGGEFFWLDDLRGQLPIARAIAERLATGGKSS